MLARLGRNNKIFKVYGGLELDDVTGDSLQDLKGQKLKVTQLDSSKSVISVTDGHIIHLQTRP